MTKNTKKLIEDENAKWLSQYRERIERRDRTLKHAAVFAIFFTLTTAIYIFAAAAVASATTSNPIFLIAFAFSIFVGLLFIFTVADIITPSEYNKMSNAGIISGIFISVIIGIIYFSPPMSAQYPISMQVLYSNTTIIQNCTAFTNTNSGYDEKEECDECDKECKAESAEG